MNIRLNKEKSIGKVLFIVEGGKTEAYILYQIFCKVLDYQMETFLRDKGYDKFNSKENPTSQVFVINAQESNIKYIEKNNEYLNRLFTELIEHYDFDIDNAAIYYLFDRDSKSNTDTQFIENLLETLVNSRDNGVERQGILLLGYPSVEAYTLSNFVEDSFEQKYDTGHDLKKAIHSLKINQSKISEATLLHAAEEMMNAINKIGLSDFDVDAFGECNREIFSFEEEEYSKERVYRVLSLLSIALIDLGILEIE